MAYYTELTPEQLDRVFVFAPELRMLRKQRTAVSQMLAVPLQAAPSLTDGILDLRQADNAEAAVAAYEKFASDREPYAALIADDLALAFGADREEALRAADCLNGELDTVEPAAAAPEFAPSVYRRVAFVTGAAQGLGEGIAEYLASQGTYLMIADLNEEGAIDTANNINAKYGEGHAAAVKINVADEEDVQRALKATVAEFGGIDILISNAGVLRAGSLDELSYKDFQFVTSINYNAYFLMAKYTSKIMKRQHAVRPEYLMDIIQINSKSGLEGSNKNSAYAGGKFGGIGLTQSFALELAPFNIKVNAVCPGNNLDGPLWTDPERGLFVQYLHAGKVPGAKTTEDVRRHYMAKVPMNRGCFPEDLGITVKYIVEQKYETGQALPVTGGQVMLN